MRPPEIRVSVIIATYNQKDYLLEAMESVLHQTVLPYEIVVADDHSTDGSQELIRDYLVRCPGRVKAVFQNENVGIPKNRNSALRQASGNYVAFLDGDDRFLPFKTERELEAIRKSRAFPCVYSNVRFIDGGGRFLRPRDSSPQPSGNIFSHVARGSFGLLRSLLIPRFALERWGGFDERFPYYDGFELTLRLAKHCEFLYLAEPLVEKREHRLSASKSLGTKASLRDLKGIYQKIFPWVQDLPPLERWGLKWIWTQRFLNLRLQGLWGPVIV